MRGNSFIVDNKTAGGITARIDTRTGVMAAAIEEAPKRFLLSELGKCGALGWRE